MLDIPARFRYYGGMKRNTLPLSLTLLLVLTVPSPTPNAQLTTGTRQSADQSPTPNTPRPTPLSEKQAEFLMQMTMPNGLLPRWGANSPQDSLSLLLQAADAYHREDMRWVATRGKKGKRPAQTAMAFPETGYYALRSGWNPKAVFLAIHNGPDAAHSHFDANSFVLTAFGQELLIDPGDLPEIPDLSRTQTHNTVTMDALDSHGATTASLLQNGTLLAVYDGTNSGFGGAQDDPTARHRRRIVYLRPALFLVVDDLTAVKPHDWTLRFHFAPGELIYRPGAQQTLFATAVAVPSAAGQPLDPNAADVARLPGGLRLWSQDDRKPTMEHGPAVSASGRVFETPCASWTISQAKTAHFATLLAPFGEAPALDQRMVKGDRDGATVAYGPIDGLITEMIRVKPNQERKDAPPSRFSTGLDTDAEVAFLRCGPFVRDSIDDSAPRIPYALAVTNATRLAWQGDPRPLTNRPANAPSQNLFTAAHPVSLLEAVWQKDTLAVHVTGGEDIRLAVFAARWLVVNGRPRVPIPHDSPFVSITP